MISKKTKYALKALEELAHCSERECPVLISTLAKKGRIPLKFLEAILLELKNNGILQSKKGKGGGYFLAKKPAQIKLSAVLRILEGPLAPLPCLSQTAYEKCKECEDEAACAIRLTMKEVYEKTVDFLEETTLEDMLDRARSAEASVTYSI